MSTGAVMLQHDVPMHGLHVETHGPDRLHEAAGASHMTGNAVPMIADTPHPASRMSGAPSLQTAGGHTVSNTCGGCDVYSCLAPFERRRFRCIVSPLPLPNIRGAVPVRRGLITCECDTHRGRASSCCSRRRQRRRRFRRQHVLLWARLDEQPVPVLEAEAGQPVPAVALQQ